FSQKSRYHQEFSRALLDHDDPEAIAGDEGKLVNFTDHFILQHRLPGGATVVEQYVAEHPDLPDTERDMLLGWRAVIEGIFEVQRREGNVLVLENLIDDLTYRVRSNMGPKAFRPMPRRSFVISRLVPVADQWLLSGLTHTFHARDREHVYAAAADLAVHQPALLFRNPDKLAQGWDLQHAERERFIRFFGTDLVVLPGEQFADRMHEYQEFSLKEVLATLPAATREDRGGTPAPRFTFTEDLLESETVAVVYDEIEGLNFYADFGLVEAIFADPALLRRRMYKER